MAPEKWYAINRRCPTRMRVGNRRRELLVTAISLHSQKWCDKKAIEKSKILRDFEDLMIHPTNEHGPKFYQMGIVQPVRRAVCAVMKYNR